MTITLGVNMITRQMAPLSYIHWYISFLYFKKFKIQFLWVSPLHYVLFCIKHIYMPKITFQTYISFFYLKFNNFWYITCFVPNLIPIWSPIPWLCYNNQQIFGTWMLNTKCSCRAWVNGGYCYKILLFLIANKIFDL